MPRIRGSTGATGSGGAGTSDHGLLTGLADDDHTQYHNNARGDLRYTPIAERVTNGNTHDHSGGDGAQIDHGGLAGTGDDDHAQYHNDTRGDARYYRENEHINSSAGVGDAGKPIVLDAAGHVDATMLNDGDIDHGSIGGLTDDDHTQYMPSDGTIRDETGCHLMKYSDTGIDNTLDTIVANGANDVTAILSYDITISESAGGTGHTSGNLTPGNNAAVYNDGVDTLTLSVAADGSVTIQRTAGAATFSVFIDMRWI